MDKLSELEQRIKHKIAQTKDKKHETQERAITDRLWPEIETLNWVLNEILVLSRQDERFYALPSFVFAFSRHPSVFVVLYTARGSKCL
jgi:hypothetical protein